MAQKDQITINRIKLMHPALVEPTLKMYDEICEALGNNVVCRFAYTLRTNQEQDAIYAQGRTKLFDSKGRRLGIVTFAKGGQSYHNYGLAFDIVLLVDKDNNGTYESASWDIKGDFDKDGIKDWEEVTKIALKYGYEFLTKNGKRWDFPHFQKTFGLSIKQLQKLTNNKGGTNFKIAA
jgi:peptidoglycan L-alanyl-D-glutamate endopeptidase CwlK